LFLTHDKNLISEHSKKSKWLDFYSNLLHTEILSKLCMIEARGWDFCEQAVAAAAAVGWREGNKIDA
jgi:hypothetical protein